MTDKGGESKYLEAKVEGLLENQVVTDLLLKKMVVRVVTKESREVLEEATFQSQVPEVLVLVDTEYFAEEGRSEISAIFFPRLHGTSYEDAISLGKIGHPAL